MSINDNLRSSAASLVSRRLPVTKRERMREECLAEIAATQAADTDAEGLLFAAGVFVRYSTFGLFGVAASPTETMRWLVIASGIFVFVDPDL